MLDFQENNMLNLDDTGKGRNKPMPKDKQLHVAAGFAVAAIFSVAFAFIGKDYWVIVGCGIGLLAGILKELYDKFIDKEKFDIEDLGHTALGAIAGSLGLWLVFHGYIAIQDAIISILK